MTNKLKGMMRRVKASTPQKVCFFANPTIASFAKERGIDIIGAPTLSRDRIIAIPMDNTEPIKIVWEN